MAQVATRQSRYNSRMQLQPGETEISPNAYNLIIGGVLLYGFLINCFMVSFCFDAAVEFFGNTLSSLILYSVCVLVGSLLIHNSSNPVISFIGYNFIVLPLGLVLSLVINVYTAAGLASTVTVAFAITGIVTIIMMLVSAIYPDFFLSLGRTLFSTLLITLVIEAVMYFIGASLGIIDYIVVLLFCGYIGYDWSRANLCVKTVDNAIDSASDLYIDIVGLFLRILRILARSQRN